MITDFVEAKFQRRQNRGSLLCLLKVGNVNIVNLKWNALVWRFQTKTYVHLSINIINTLNILNFIGVFPQSSILFICATLCSYLGVSAGGSTVELSSIFLIFFRVILLSSVIHLSYGSCVASSIPPFDELTVHSKTSKIHAELIVYCLYTASLFWQGNVMRWGLIGLVLMFLRE